MICPKDIWPCLYVINIKMNYFGFSYCIFYLLTCYSLKKNAHRIFNYPFKPTNVNWGFWLSPVFIYYPRKQFSEKQLQQEAMAAHLPPKVMPGWMPVKLIICLFTNWLVDGQNNESQSSTTHARFIQTHYWFFLNFKYSVFLLILVFPP